MTDRGADLATNRALWTLVNAEFTDARARRAWDADDITWGLFEIPERSLGVLGDVAGLDVVDLGCGTALLRRVARAPGRARRRARRDACAAREPRVGASVSAGRRSRSSRPTASRFRCGACVFDLVVSEYGASVWCDPERWVAEAARLLRPGGRVVFLTNSVLATLCVPEDEGVAEERLVRPQRGLHRTEWPGGGIEFHPGHGEWIRILRGNGFEVEALHELHAPVGAAPARVLRHRERLVGRAVAGRGSLDRSPRSLSGRHSARSRCRDAAAPGSAGGRTTRCGRPARRRRSTDTR